METACPVCGCTKTSVVYAGPVRRGRFGEYVDGVVHRCADCALDRLASAALLADEDYRTDAYRQLVGEGPDASSFFAVHDEEQFDKMPMLKHVVNRGDTVADVGCAAGAFLDLIGGMAGLTVGIEPAESYHQSLRERGHQVFSDLEAAAEVLESSVDLAVSFSVVEHVEDPLRFLKDIRRLVRPSGAFLVSTPNRDDLLLRCGAESYRSFFYRVAHRYYFDAGSLSEALRRASFAVETVRFRHRFGFTNFVAWLHDGRPIGESGPAVLSPDFDERWRHELESRGVADYLYVTARAC
jgi:2-polyprenyl-3-methyl-5-hydroxy-6-metoxy-1,4-benzoquinol methylase